MLRLISFLAISLGTLQFAFADDVEKSDIARNWPGNVCSQIRRAKSWTPTWLSDTA